VLAGVLLLISLIIFPVMVSKALNSSLRETTWHVGWAYMLDWGSLVIVIFAIILLAADRNPDETSVMEKVVRSQ